MMTCKQKAFVVMVTIMDIRFSLWDSHVLVRFRHEGLLGQMFQGGDSEGNRCAFLSVVILITPRYHLLAEDVHHSVLSRS